VKLRWLWSVLFMGVVAISAQAQAPEPAWLAYSEPWTMLITASGEIRRSAINQQTQGPWTRGANVFTSAGAPSGRLVGVASHSERGAIALQDEGTTYESCNQCESWSTGPNIFVSAGRPPAGDRFVGMGDSIAGYVWAVTGRGTSIAHSRSDRGNSWVRAVRKSPSRL
jgi:hypothetical protein